MKLLAIETTTNACSVALQLGADMAETHVVEARAHTQILMRMISELLSQGGVRPADLDGVVLGNGPGSFIGMRIGAAVAQGLCHGAGLGLLPRSSLAAVAAEAMLDAGVDKVAVVQDAHMREVYLGCYIKGEDGLPLAGGPERICSVGELPLSGDAYAGAGAAWQQYPALLEANRRRITGLLPQELPRARHLLRLHAAAPAIEPAALLPAYLRTKVADIPARRP